MEKENKIPLVVVVGPTASGKTALGVQLAKALNGEVVSADSMQIYRGMDIATAKPTKEEMEGIPHHLLDFVPVNDAFSLADYLALAHKTVQDVFARGKLPIVVGGTGLYISNLLDNTEMWEEQRDSALREELLLLAKEKGNAFLLAMLAEIDPATASRLHENNVNRIVRAIEVYRLTGRTMDEQQRESHQKPSPYHAVVIGLDYRDRAVLYERIDRRVDIMLQNGLLKEAQTVLSSPLSTSAQAIGYKELAPFLRGEKTLAEAVEQLKRSSRRYAKRQLTWFRRDSRVNWLYPDCNEKEKLLEKALFFINREKICDSFIK